MILVDDETTLMGPSDFDDLPEYSCSLPTGAFVGKRWKRKKWWEPGWQMLEYTDHPDPKLIGICCRELIVV